MDLDEYAYESNIRFPTFSDVADESMFLPDHMSCGLKRPVIVPVDPPNRVAMQDTCGWRPKPNPWAGKPIASAIENMSIVPSLQLANRNQCPQKTTCWQRSGDAHRTFGSSEYFSVGDLTSALAQNEAASAMFMMLIILVGIAFFLAYGVSMIRRDLTAIRRLLKREGRART